MNGNFLLSPQGMWDDETQYDNISPLLGAGAPLYIASQSVYFNGSIYFVNGTAIPQKGVNPDQDSAWTVFYTSPDSPTILEIDETGDYAVGITQPGFQFNPTVSGINIVFNTDTTDYGVFTFRVLDSNDVTITLTDSAANELVIQGKNQLGWYVVSSDGTRITTEYITNIDTESSPVLVELLPNGTIRQTGTVSIAPNQSTGSATFAAPFNNIQYIFISLPNTDTYSYAYGASSSGINVTLNVVAPSGLTVYYQITGN